MMQPVAFRIARQLLFIIVCVVLCAWISVAAAAHSQAQGLGHTVQVPLDHGEKARAWPSPALF